MNRRRFLTALTLPVLAAGGLFGWRSNNNPYYSGPTSDHFDGVRFFIGEFAKDKSPFALMQWQLAGGKAAWPTSLPAFTDKPPQRVNGSALRVSYVGHATLLIQTHGLNLLIDPVWAERASPFQFAGPKRANAPGIALDDLPPLDAILISHNHYDHLDLATVGSLAKSHPKALILTPLGNDAIMLGAVPADRIRTFDWGGKFDLGPGASVHFEPCYHWSARSLFDKRMALWCAFVIETPSGKIYHIADTGFGDGAPFREAQEKHGPFRLAIIPIGAYEPRWFMEDFHVNPTEAVKILQVCGAEQALAHHWGTFQLTDEAHDEPPRKLEEALVRENISPSRFAVKRPGEVLELATN
jgi:L-ascorbate metabolism protein UlaG (beta-lactamase superfamily)